MFESSHIFSRNIHMMTGVICIVVWVLGPICIIMKSLSTPHLFNSHETQNFPEMIVNASTYILSTPHDFFPMISLPPRRHPMTLELGPRESLKTCITTFNFGCFWYIFYYSGPGHIFSRNISRSVEVTCNIARVLGTIRLSSKSL